LFPYLEREGDIAIPHTTPSKGSGAGSPYAQGFVWNAWGKGLRRGVIASSDHYSTRQSYACVYATDLTAEASHAALWNRRTYAATDNIVVKFRAAAPDGAVPYLREEFKARPIRSSRLKCAARRRSSGPNSSATDVFCWPGGQEPAPITSRTGTGNAAPGNRYYYVRVVQANRQLAWSSAIWVTAQPAAGH
jgi:hypothetical protein